MKVSHESRRTGRKEGRKEGWPGVLSVIFIIAFSAKFSIAKSKEEIFGDFNSRYGGNWIAKFDEKGNPLYLYGGRFDDPKEEFERVFNPFPNWKFVPPGRSYVVEEAQFPVEGFKIAIDKFIIIPYYISPNGDSVNDSGSFHFVVRVAHTDGLESLSSRNKNSKDMRFYLHYEIEIKDKGVLSGMIEIFPPFDCVPRDEDECYWVRIKGDVYWDGNDRYGNILSDGIYEYKGRFYVRRVMDGKEKIISEIVLPYQEFVIDTTPPSVEIFSPVDGGVYTELPFFRLKFWDELSGVDKFYFRLNGEDVTQRFDVRDGEAQYFPEVMDKKAYVFDVSIIDKAGNVYTKAIRFSYLSEEEAEEYVYVLSFLEDLSSIYGFEEDLKDLKLIESESFEGVSQYTFQQTYDGLPVYGYQLVVFTARDGLPSSIFGDYYSDIPYINTTPSITFENAFQKTIEKIGIQKEKLDIIPTYGMLPDQKVIYIKDGTPHLAYRVYIQYKDEGGSQFSYEGIVDGHTGEVLEIIPLFNAKVVYNKPACVVTNVCGTNPIDVTLKGVTEEEKICDGQTCYSYKLDTYDVKIRDNKAGEEKIKMYSSTQPLCFDQSEEDKEKNVETTDTQYADIVNGWYWLRTAHDYFSQKVEEGYTPDHPITYDVNVELSGGKLGETSYDFHWCCYWVQLVQFDKGGNVVCDCSRDPTVAFHEYGHVYHNEVLSLPQWDIGAYITPFKEAVATFFCGAISKWAEGVFGENWSPSNLPSCCLWKYFKRWPKIEDHLKGSYYSNYAWAYNKNSYDNDKGEYVKEDNTEKCVLRDYTRTEWWVDHFWRVKTLIGDKMDKLMHPLLHKVGSIYTGFGEAFDALLSADDEEYNKSHWYEIYLSQIIAGFGKDDVSSGHLPYTYAKTIKYDDFKENGVDFYYASRIGRKIKMVLSPFKECLENETQLNKCLNEKKAFLSSERELSIINPFKKDVDDKNHLCVKFDKEPPIQDFCTTLGYGWICNHLGFDKINVKGEEIPEEILNVWKDYVFFGALSVYYAGLAYDFDEGKWTISTLRKTPDPIKYFVVTNIPSEPPPGWCVMGKGRGSAFQGIISILLIIFLIRLRFMKNRYEP